MAQISRHPRFQDSAVARPLTHSLADRGLVQVRQDSGARDWELIKMRMIYAVSTLPVRDTSGAIRGWVRSDLFADGTKPTDIVILRDGSAWGQKDAIEEINRDPSLLYATRDEAVRDGLARLKRADAGEGKR